MTDSFKIRVEANDLTLSQRTVLWNELVKVQENMPFAQKILMIEWNTTKWKKDPNALGQNIGSITNMPCAVCETLMVVASKPEMFKCPKCSEEDDECGCMCHKGASMYCHWCNQNHTSERLEKGDRKK